MVAEWNHATAKTYRLRDEAVDALNAKRIKLIVERKEDVKESDLLGALIWKHLSTLTAQDVKAYRETESDKGDIVTGIRPETE